MFFEMHFKFLPAVLFVLPAAAGAILGHSLRNGTAEPITWLKAVTVLAKPMSANLCISSSFRVSMPDAGQCEAVAASAVDRLRCLLCTSLLWFDSLVYFVKRVDHSTSRLLNLCGDLLSHVWRIWAPVSANHSTKVAVRFGAGVLVYQMWDLWH